MKDDEVIIYSLATQYVNLGDLLINQVLIEWLKKSSTVVIENKGVPDWFLEQVAGVGSLKASDDISRYSIKSVKFYQTILFSKASINAVMISPGHLGDDSFKKNIKKAMVLLIAIFLKMKGVSTCRVGVSFGKLSFVGRLIESLSATVFVVYSVRDMATKEKLFSFGQEKCVVIPDLSFLAYDRLKNYLVEECQHNKLLLSFRGDRRYPHASKQYENMIYSDIPKEAATLFDDVICYSQVEFDKDEQCKLSKLLSMAGNVVSLKEEYTNLEKAACHLSEANVVISNRLHVLLPAMMLGRLTLAVGSKHVDSKIVAIFKDMGLIHLFYDVEDKSENFLCFLSRALKNKAINIEKANIAIEKQSDKTKKLMCLAFGY